jgi:hypothetical protein
LLPKAREPAHDVMPRVPLAVDAAAVDGRSLVPVIGRHERQPLLPRGFHRLCPGRIMSVGQEGPRINIRGGDRAE